MNHRLWPVVLSLFLAACGRSPSSQKTVPTTTAVSNAPVLIPLAPMAEKMEPAIASTNQSLNFEIFSAEIHSGNIETMGLKSVVEAPEHSKIEWQSLTDDPVLATARANTNVILNLLGSSTHAGKTLPDETSPFLQILTQRPGVFISGTWPVNIEAGKTGHVSAVSGSTVMLAVETNGYGVNYLTTNLGFGLNIEIAPRMTTRGSVDMNTTAVISHFGGYEKNTKGPGGKAAPQPGLPIKPIFRAQILAAHAEIATNEMLVLLGPWRTNTGQFRSRVPVLSDIPYYGRLFNQSSTFTNVERTMIVIQPK
jgi:hypothetical protein